jgi:hypothetical protein
MKTFHDKTKPKANHDLYAIAARDILKNHTHKRGS